MRLHRLSLKNWRGVEEREVLFAGAGVTVVEGPNESGKSSLVEALDALFTHLDDSKKREVLAVKPVHKDAGAEVEADIETGPYRFVYAKRFHKRPETRLTVSSPRAESLTGREAHERARQILEETMDLALWSALRIEQGQEVTQAALAEQKSLSAALDRAAGVVGGGEAEESLHARVRAEFERYFTPNGAPRKETTNAEAEVARLEAALAADRAELARLVADVERSAQLDREALDAKKAVDEAAKSLAQHEERLRDIDRLAVRVRDAKAALDAATSASTEALRTRTDREKLVAEAESAAAGLAKLAAEEELALPALTSARNDFDEAERALVQESERAEEAEREAGFRAREFAFAKDAIDLQLLGERKKRIDAADAAAAQAEALLAKNVVTDDLLKKLQAAHLDAEKARAALAAGSPELRVRALADIEPIVDGRPRRLAKGDETTVSVAGPLALVFPGVAEIEIRSGSSTADLRDALDKRDRKLRESLDAAGVADMDAAAQANAALQAARRDVEARDRTLVNDLRDLTRETIAQKIATLAARVDAYRSSRDASSALPTDYDAAETADRAAKSAVDSAKARRVDAEKRRDAARRHAETLREARGQAALSLERAKTQAAMATARLAEARARATDDDVLRRIDATAASLAAAESAHRAESARLADSQPDETRNLADNARATSRRVQERLRSLEDERIAVQTRLKERGESGLAERVDATESKLVRAKDDLERRRVHAAAAKLLFETLDAERAASRRAYVAPLRQRIEGLARHVYGPDFAVELNDALQIATRTLGGCTVPFESLSGGAKEQLGVISRLACALIVADGDGVPVVFDDTLGNTDPSRIESMGALLALAGKKCQVIVLTCVPERFRHVGGATVVRTG